MTVLSLFIITHLFVRTIGTECLGLACQGPEDGLGGVKAARVLTFILVTLVTEKQGPTMLHIYLEVKMAIHL